MKFEANPDTGSGDFLRIDPGQKVTGVFRGNPREFYAKFEGGKSIECKSVELGAKFRFRINFIQKSPEGEYNAKIWEQGATVYNNLKELNTEVDLENSVVSIKRVGEGLNTSYMIIPMGELNEEKKQLIGLVNLKHLVPQAEPDLSQAPMPDAEEELPF